MDPTERFAELVADEAIPLAEVAALIGAIGEPGADIAATLRAIDALAESVTDRSVSGVVDALFVQAGFGGDRRSYYDPRNSFLHQVIGRRVGIPISLSVLMIEVGHRCGVNLAGVGTPAHFLVRTLDEAEPVFVDAFNGGACHNRASLDPFFSRIAPGVDIEPYLVPLPTVDIVRRLLTNLVIIYRRLGNRDGLLWTSRLRTMLPGCDISHIREYSSALAASGDFARAAKVRESLAALPGGDVDRERAEADQLRARLN